MKIHLLRSWVLTDEHPKAAKGTPALIDMETQKIYHPGDRVMGVSAKQVVSLAVEARGGNYFLPEEMKFISCFTRGDRSNQWGHEAAMGNLKKLTYEEVESLRRG
jgi:hypothetical protein